MTDSTQSTVGWCKFCGTSPGKGETACATAEAALAGCPWLSTVDRDDLLPRTQSTAGGAEVKPTDADLPPFGWAPGHYTFMCWDCEEREWNGAKGSTCCRNCAVKKWEAAQVPALPALVPVRAKDMDGLTLAQRLDEEERYFTKAVENAYDEDGPGVMPGDVEGMFYRIRDAAGLNTLAQSPAPAPAVGEIYVPGLWRCAKCEFTLVQSNLNALDGTVTARDAPGDKCPNCGVSLWRVTWKDQAFEIGKRAEEQLARAIATEEELACLRADRDALAGGVPEELRRLSDAATPGEWTVSSDDNRPAYILGVSTNPAISDPDVILSPAYSDRSHEDDQANIKLAAKLVNDLRARIATEDRAARPDTTRQTEGV